MEGTTETLLRALDWSLAANAQILNLSFTGPRDPLVEAGVAAAIERGALLVAAAGNKGPGSPPLYPGAYPGVIAVSATDARNAAYAMANTGPHVSISAPGVDILTPRPDKAYDFGSGTSYAAAHISGVLALILERNTDFTADDLTAALLGSAQDLGANGRDDIFGAGLADAEQAVTRARDAVRKASAAR
jgi:subtilisin family serine protease